MNKQSLPGAHAAGFAVFVLQSLHPPGITICVRKP